MKIKERTKRYFRKEVHNHMTQVRYSPKTFVEPFSELAEKKAESPSIGYNHLG